MKEYNPQGGSLPHSLLPGVASYRRQPRAIESTTPVGLAYHQRLSQNKYTIVECDTAIYRETKSRGRHTNGGYHRTNTSWLNATSPFIIRQNHEGKAYHGQLSQNKYIMVECDTTIYHKTKSRFWGNTINVITN